MTGRQVGTLTVMMTGRLSSLSPQVEKILAAHGVVPDRCLFNTSGGNTLDYKCAALRAMAAEHPDLEEASPKTNSRRVLLEVDSDSWWFAKSLSLVEGRFHD
eukprot:8559531-Pyramimonas_sp.AAC.1